MSFTQDIRRELMRKRPRGRGRCLALLRAFLVTSGVRTASFFSFSSEHPDVAEYMYSLVEKLFSVGMKFEDAQLDPINDRHKLTFSYSGSDANDILNEIFFCSVSREEERVSYLAGAFLGGGSCTLPRAGARTGYHLEFILASQEDAAFLGELLEEFQLLPGFVTRDNKTVVYFKSREAISDVLSVLGAGDSLQQLEDTAAVRDESNHRNRLENCMAGNVDRSLTASAGQVHRLAELKKRGKFSALSEELKELAAARIENPTFTYSELATHLGISRSCLQHRMKKLMTICEEELL